MFERNSRYANVEIARHTVTRPDGTREDVAHTRRRFIPPPAGTTLAEHIVVRGDRIDNVTARYLGDPTEYWRLCDANKAVHPDELTHHAGRVIRIVLADH
jgi:hypothetical protein